MLTVYIDFKCPDSYLALDPTQALALRCGVTIRWRACPMPQRDLPEEGADPAVIASHQRTRLRAQRAIHQKYAALRGIDLRFPDDTPKTDYSLGVLSCLAGDPLPFVRAAFAAFWDEHRDLDEPAVVADLLHRVGIAYSGEEPATRAALADAREFAENHGVVATPAYELDRQIFVGRQHLPWIEEALCLQTVTTDEAH